MTRHSPYVIKLSAADRAVLEKRSRSYTARHADVVRAKIVLLCADGHQNTAIAARLDVHVNVVSTWRKRFFEEGLDGLADRPRPGRPRSAPSEVAEVRAMDGEPTEERGVPPSQWSSTESAAQAAAEGVVVPVTGPGAIRGADRARGRRPARRSRRPSSNAPAPAGQLIPFQSRYNATTSLDALRRLVSSINRYLAEIDAEHARNRAGVPARTRR
jgi:transposase